MLFRNKLCLAVDGANLEKVQGVARDFRGCTTTVKIGPSLLLAWGPYAVRGLSELGMSDIILDARLFGHHQELWQAVTEAAKTAAVKGIVVQTLCGRDLLSLAVEAADKSRAVSLRADAPVVLGMGVPATFTPRVLAELNIALDSRRALVCQQAILCRDAGLHGLIVEYEDIAAVCAVCPELPLIANTRKRVESYEIALSRQEARQPGVCDVLRAGATHAVLDMTLIGHDAEWCADMVGKDLKTLKRRRRP